MWAKNLSQMYSMLVCLVTCMVLMVSLTIILISVVNISFPETKNAKELARYASNEVFLQSFRNGYSDAYRTEKVAKGGTGLSQNFRALGGARRI